MNSTFKVVFNKARGALMVVNEVTSSVQAKGTKTVVAAAVATMLAGAGAAVAADLTWEELDAMQEWTSTNETSEGATLPSGLVIKQDAELAAGESIKFVGLKETDGNTINALHNVDGDVTNNGLIYVTAKDIIGGNDASSLVAMSSSYNKIATATNNGQIYLEFV